MSTEAGLPLADRPADPARELRVLTEEECRHLLRTGRFGRLAFTVNHEVMILPVNYGFDETSIVVQTGPGLKLDEAPMNAVAFEIGDADPEGAWGWSVVVQGPCFDVSDAIDEPTARLRELPIHPWPAGSREHWLRVVARSITGRAFGTLPAQRSP
jgi:nitroimidazol reductase NimA-like FMN-containing flavoprotein (pyridoxamine 5'-phosphate oxidase superfamily)